MPPVPRGRLCLLLLCQELTTTVRLHSSRPPSPPASRPSRPSPVRRPCRHHQPLQDRSHSCRRRGPAEAQKVYPHTHPSTHTHPHVPTNTVIHTHTHTHQHTPTLTHQHTPTLTHIPREPPPPSRTSGTGVSPQPVRLTPHTHTRPAGGSSIHPQHPLRDHPPQSFQAEASRPQPGPQHSSREVNCATEACISSKFP
ncbi:unnamed protein product [Gulo gulo]|uniref:Uncharacterized protein n=1 Tax=Gulo gulo TaxID=48420 RepID=A0A9X9LHH1_GULGU|nr:unnamed protein product [Gulo gulo]